MASPRETEYKPGEKTPEVAERWQKALELRKAGASYQQIADKLGYEGASGAYNAVMGAIKATLREPAAEVRALELDRLDRLMVGMWKRAGDGDEKAVASVLSIMDRRARLLGLDAPTRAVVETAVKGYAVGNGPDDLWTSQADSTEPTGPPGNSGDAPTPS
jgi:hypothetical protein